MLGPWTGCLSRQRQGPRQRHNHQHQCRQASHRVLGGQRFHGSCVSLKIGHSFSLPTKGRLVISGFAVLLDLCVSLLPWHHTEARREPARQSDQKRTPLARWPDAMMGSRVVHWADRSWLHWLSRLLLSHWASWRHMLHHSTGVVWASKRSSTQACAPEGSTKMVCLHQTRAIQLYFPIAVQFD